MSQIGGAPPLGELLDHIESIAPLPHVAGRVVQVAEDERFSAYDLAAIIATDTAMTAKILRLANSAYYGFPRRIATVRDAVVLIGFRAVRATAVAAAVADLFPKQGSTRFDADLFWAHCVACGSVAEIIAKETNQARPDEAFTAGILHDIGRLVLAQYVPGPFDRALDQALERGAAMEAVETDVFGYDHAQLGAALTQRWNLPIEICTAIAGHHDLTVDPAEAPLTYVLAQSNRFCRSVGFWCGLDTAEGARVYDVNEPADPEIAALVEDKLGGIAGLEARVREFLSSSNDREQRWYTPVETVAAGPAADVSDLGDAPADRRAIA